MTQTVDDLLEYSRVGKSGMKLKEADINQLVQIVINRIGVPKEYLNQIF